MAAASQSPEAMSTLNEYSGGYIAQLTMSGTAVASTQLFFITGLTDPIGIAISPVPEPDTWVPITGTLGLLGGLQWFRRRN